MCGWASRAATTATASRSAHFVCTSKRTVAKATRGRAGSTERRTNASASAATSATTASAPQGERERQREERQRGDQEPGPRHPAAEGIAVAGVVDEHRERDSRDEERLGAAVRAPEQHEPGAGGEQHGREHEQSLGLEEQL